MTKFCTQCGATLADNARFCKKCGAQVAPTQPTTDYQAPGSVNPQQTYAQGSYQYQAQQAQQAQTPDYNQFPYQVPPGPGMARADLKPNIAGMLCYPLSFITGIIFLVLSPYNKDRFVKFHAYQSIFFGAALIVLRIAVAIISIVLPWALENLLHKGVSLITFVGIVYAMYKAYQGEMFKLPFVGDLAEQQASK